MNAEQRPTDSTSRESSAHRALNAYRERRRRRRGEDTFFGTAEGLIPGAEERTGSEWQRRRSDLLEEAVEAGMPTQLAEKLYEISLEEGLDPELAYEVVCSGLGVLPPPEGISNAPEQPTVDKYLPSWMFPPLPADEVLRERTLRFSFRRVRRLIEEHGDTDAALRAFAEEPDVGPVGY